MRGSTSHDRENWKERSSKRIDGLDFLRGIASLSVCWFHLTSFTYHHTDGWFYSFLRTSASYGWLGVEVFFVISGFVIPYALRRANYRLSAYPAFLLKRIIRLDPPYLVGILIFILLAFAYAFHTGRPPEVEGAPLTWARVLLHLGYLNMFFHQEWLNPAFWTLAIEFQYYILMGLAFPLFTSGRRQVRLAALVCFAATPFFSGHELMPGGVPFSTFIFHFMFLFLMGITTFQYRVGLSGGAEYAATLSLVTLGAFVTLGAPSTVAGLFAVSVICLYNRKNVVSDFFGNISYSLYLLHWPVGHLVLSILGGKLLGASDDATKTVVLLVALGVSFAASYALYALVERPAQRWSSRIKYVHEGVSAPGTQPARQVPHTVR
ncbi:MAG TPA: acyltransferase [Pyrinomonadaceae bacterium]|nr:acyltransferase [Pyrinomonadaceae bacterium]